MGESRGGKAKLQMFLSATRARNLWRAIIAYMREVWKCRFMSFLRELIPSERD